MENKKRSKIQTVCNTGLLVGLVGLMGIVGGGRFIEELNITNEIKRFPQVGVYPMEGEGSQSLNRSHIGDPDRYHADLRESIFMKDNPSYDGTVRFDQKYIVRSNDINNASNQ